MKGNFWTDVEDNQLVRMKGDGLTDREIATCIPGKTAASVTCRWYRLPHSKREGLCDPLIGMISPRTQPQL